MNIISMKAQQMTSGTNPDKDRKYFYVEKDPETGFLQTIDKRTGAVVAVQRSYEDMYGLPSEPSDILSERENRLIRTELEDGTIVLLEHGVSLDEVDTLVSRKKWVFSENLAEVICSRIVNGASMTSLGKMKDMPSFGVLSRWRSEHPEFALMIDNAKRDRAELFFDKAIDVAENVVDKEEAVIGKFKHEVYKYAAQIGKPSEFSPQKNVKAEIGVTSFVIDTGIRRAGDDGYNIDETEKIKMLSQQTDNCEAEIRQVEEIIEEQAKKEK